MTVGETLKSLREKVNMTQKELADKLGVSASHISQYERNLRNPSQNQLKKFADALGVSFDVLLASKIDDITKSGKQIQPDIIDCFSITEAEEKLTHIGFQLKKITEEEYLIENADSEYKISKEVLRAMNDKCNLFLKFLLFELKNNEPDL